MDSPIIYVWDGTSMVPLPKFERKCNEQFVVGYKYLLEEIHERSVKSHNHAFGWLTESWRQLPEEYIDLYPSPEHLRKRALIAAGYYNETIVDAGTKEGAFQFAATLRARDDFAMVSVSDTIVVIRDAKSQSRRSMKKKEFQESKTKIMDIIADLIGVTPEQLLENAGQAA